MRRFVERVDQFRQVLQEGTSRRSMIRSLTGGAAASLLAALGAAWDPAPAAANHRRRCRRAQQPCASGRQCCTSRSGRVCLNNGCGGGTVCCSPSGGRCVADCDCCGSGLCNFQLGVCV